MLIELILLSGTLLAVIAFAQAASLRWAIAETVLLAGLGFLFGGLYLLAGALLPQSVGSFIAPLIAPHLPAEAFLWIFLPILLFQAAVSVNVRDLLADLAPILLLAVLAVFVATGMIGVAVAGISSHTLVEGLLLGAMISTTDPSAVLAVFHQVGAPARLVRLVEGESLLNDAAAIAIVGVLLAVLTGQAEAATPLLALRALAVSFIGGLAVGALAGRIVAWMLPRLGGVGKAEVSLVLALPYPLYMVVDQSLHWSGVVAVVGAGLVISGLGRTRLSIRNWRQLQLILDQAASIAGAAVFLLAAIRVPETLRQAQLADCLVLAVVVATALLARLVVVFGTFPLLGKLRLAAPVSSAYKIVIAWGGLRGAVTLVLAIGIAENAALPEATRRFVATLATGFVLVSLLVNGTTLKLLIKYLGLDQLSVQDQALQAQVVRLSADAVQQGVATTAQAFGLAPAVAAEVQRDYEREIGPGMQAAALEAVLKEPERLAAGLVALASRERDLIPRFGAGVIAVHNLDTMMRVTEAMIDAARAEGRIGYRRAARALLNFSYGFTLAALASRHLRWHQPLAHAIANRFELLICRRVVVNHLREYAHHNLVPLFGARLVSLLEVVLDERIVLLDQALDELRARVSGGTGALEHRLLLLSALQQGRATLAEMIAQRSISKELFDALDRAFEDAWQRAVQRPQPAKGK